MIKTPIFIATIIVVAGLGFFGGMKYSQSTSPNNARSGAQGANGAAGQFRNRTGARAGQAGGGFTNGDVIKKDANSITVKTADGGSKIIFYSNTTTFMKSTNGTINDIVVGQTITANGQANSDGSIAAQSVQVRPQLAPGQGRGPGTGGGSGTGGQGQGGGQATGGQNPASPTPGTN